MILLYMINGLLAIIREIEMFIDIKKLKTLIKKLNEAKVLVIGDLALDEMVYGDTERISREAPVLILQHTHTKTPVEPKEKIKFLNYIWRLTFLSQE